MEERFISLFPSPKIGDDGAVLPPPPPGRRWVVVKDLLVEGTHFKLEWERDWYWIGAKGVLANLSDIGAMGGRPRFGLVGVGFPKGVEWRLLESLAKGILETGRRWGVEFVGGDTVRADRLTLSITLIGEVGKRAIWREVRKGDEVAITGQLGKVERELRQLLRRGRGNRKYKLLYPSPPLRFMEEASRLVRGGMDITDGLFRELNRLSRRNRVGFKLFTPISGRVGCSGEEFEFLFSYPPRHRLALLRRGRRNRIKITPIGRAIRGRFKLNCRSYHF